MNLKYEEKTKTKTETILNMSASKQTDDTSISNLFKVNNLPINYPTDCGQYIQMYYRSINNNPTKFTKFSDTEFFNCATIFGLPSER